MIRRSVLRTIRPPNIGNHPFTLVLAVIVLAGAASCSSCSTSEQAPLPVEVRPHVETPAPQPTPEELKQKRLAQEWTQAREAWAKKLELSLRDEGFDISVSVDETLGQSKFELRGDMFTDTTTRTQTLQDVRAIPNICALFREVRISTGLFSGSDYSLHCAGRK